MVVMLQQAQDLHTLHHLSRFPFFHNTLDALTIYQGAYYEKNIQVLNHPTCLSTHATAYVHTSIHPTFFLINVYHA